MQAYIIEWTVGGRSEEMSLKWLSGVSSQHLHGWFINGAMTHACMQASRRVPVVEVVRQLVELAQPPGA